MIDNKLKPIINRKIGRSLSRFLGFNRRYNSSLEHIPVFEIVMKSCPSVSDMKTKPKVHEGEYALKGVPTLEILVPKMPLAKRQGKEDSKR